MTGGSSAKNAGAIARAVTDTSATWAAGVSRETASVSRCSGRAEPDAATDVVMTRLDHPGDRASSPLAAPAAAATGRHPRMSALTYEHARTIVAAALDHGREAGHKPLTVAVLDTGGHLVALGRADGSGFLRPDVAIAKAHGVIGLMMDSRAIAARASDSPEFFTSVAALAGGKVFSVPGGVFVCDADGEVIGAAGASGDASAADEEAVVAGIRAAGLTPRTGADG